VYPAGPLDSLHPENSDARLQGLHKGWFLPSVGEKGPSNGRFLPLVGENATDGGAEPYPAAP